MIDKHRVTLTEAELRSGEPRRIELHSGEDGALFCGGDSDADYFDDSDAELWRSGRFASALEGDPRLEELLYARLELSESESPESESPESEIPDKNVLSIVSDPFVEVACGPGMGLAPTLLRLRPELHALVTDASRLLVSEWHRFLYGSSCSCSNSSSSSCTDLCSCSCSGTSSDSGTKLCSSSDSTAHDSLGSDIRERITLAQCSLFELPLADESVGCVTGFLALGSTRSGKDGIRRALSELRRVLRPGGHFITVENEWRFDRRELVSLFRELGTPIWSCFDEGLPTWSERLSRSGFESVEYPAWTRAIRADDNELGELAVRRGVKIELAHTLYLCKKPEHRSV